jgi:hypothetical protein
VRGFSRYTLSLGEFGHQLKFIHVFEVHESECVDDL